MALLRSYLVTGDADCEESFVLAVVVHHLWVVRHLQMVVHSFQVVEEDGHLQVVAEEVVYHLPLRLPELRPKKTHSWDYLTAIQPRKS